MISKSLAISIALASIYSQPALAGTCAGADVCGDVESSFVGTVISEGFVGTVISEGVRLDWNVLSEGDIRGYRIGRYDCSQAEHCTVWTHLVMATGSCGAPQAYQVVDAPDGDAERWTYRIQVWRSDGTLGCAVDIKPE